MKPGSFCFDRITNRQSKHSGRGIIGGGISVITKRVENVILVGVPLVGTLLSPFWVMAHKIGLIEISAFIFAYLFCGLGVGLGYHRFFSHRSFVPATWLIWGLAAAGSMACQGSILRWVLDHRRHHAYTDACGDVHSPYLNGKCVAISTFCGLAHAHFGWLFDSWATDVRVFGRDLINDPIVVFFHRTRWLWPALSLLAPWLWGYFWADAYRAWGCLLFAGCVRITVFQNIVWAVNSIGHRYGYQTYKLNNGSRNNRLLAWATFGDGWHNNHHRYPRSAFHGIAPSETDFSGFIISSLERCGLADNVRRPSATFQNTGDNL